MNVMQFPQVKYLVDPTMLEEKLHMPLRELRAFYMTARLGSLTKAADVLHSSQPTISRQISNLERELEVDLFMHGHRPLRLTPAGEALLRLAQPFFDGLAHLTATGGALDDDATITIVATQTMSTLYLPYVIGEFRAQHPRSKVHLIAGTRAEALSMIEEGHAGLGVLPDPEMPTQFSFEPLLEMPMVLITPPGHPLMEAEKVDLALIAMHPLILLKRGTSTRMIIEACFRRIGLRCEPVVEVESFELVKRLVAMGYGVTIGPRYGSDHLGQQTLRVRPLDAYFPPLRIGIVTLNGQGISRTVASLIEVLRAHLRHSRYPSVGLQP